jgi:hypothetical protein
VASVGEEDANTALTRVALKSLGNVLSNVARYRPATSLGTIARQPHSAASLGNIARHRQATSLGNVARQHRSATSLGNVAQR